MDAKAKPKPKPKPKPKLKPTPLSRALVLVKEKGAITLVPELVELVAGESIKGTWWAHPKGNAIYEVANELEDHEDVITAKLIDGKVTYVHRALWPALVRVVTDRKWRSTRTKELDAETKKLLTKVEKAGALVASEKKIIAKQRKSLEASLLVRSFQEHTESGHHATTLESWKTWAETNNTFKSALALSFEEASATLLAHRIKS